MRLALDPIAFVRFVDGRTRQVFEAEGRQFVVADDGRQWPIQEPGY